MPQHIRVDQVNPKEISEEVTPLAKLLVGYLNCAYYTLQCPFRLEYDRSQSHIAANYNKYLRMVYVVVAVAAQFILFYDSIILTSSTFSWVPDTLEGDIRVILDSIMNFVWILLNTSMKWELWHAPGRIEPVFALLIRLENKLQHKQWTHFGLLKYPTFIAVILHAHMTAFSVWEVSMTLLNRNNTSVYSSVEASTYQIVHQTAVVASELYENQVLQTSSKLVPLISFIFASLAYALNLNRTDYENNEINEVLGLVNEISVRNKICFGFTIAAICFCQLPYCAQFLHSLLTASLSQRFQYIYYLSLLLIQLWLGAEAHLKFSSMNSLAVASVGLDCCLDVSPTYSEATWPLNRRTLLVDACNQNRLGVRGHFMTFTYPLLGNINLWILAYAVTVIQFQSLQSPCL